MIGTLVLVLFVVAAYLSIVYKVQTGPIAWDPGLSYETFNLACGRCNTSGRVLLGVSPLPFKVAHYPQMVLCTDGALHKWDKWTPRTAQEYLGTS